MGRELGKGKRGNLGWGLKDYKGLDGRRNYLERGYNH